MTRLTDHWRFVRQGDQYLSPSPRERRERWLLAALLTALAVMIRGEW